MNLVNDIIGLVGKRVTVRCDGMYCIGVLKEISNHKTNPTLTLVDCTECEKYISLDSVAWISSSFKE